MYLVNRICFDSPLWSSANIALRSIQTYFGSTFTFCPSSWFLEFCSFYLQTISEDMYQHKKPRWQRSCQKPSSLPAPSVQGSRCAYAVSAGEQGQASSAEQLQDAYRSVWRTWIRCSMAWMPTSSRYFCLENRQTLNGRAQTPNKAFLTAPDKAT